MKKKAYNILSRIPFISTYIKYVVCDPTFTCSPFLVSESADVLREWALNHPDEVITRKIGREILAKKISSEATNKE